MQKLRRPLYLLGLGLLGAAACAPRDSVEAEIMMSELEDQVLALQAQLDYAYAEMLRISGELTENVGHLEGAIADVDRRVLDLQGPAEPELARREVEAAVGVANQRLAAVRATAAELARSLAY